jgi:hypothetical protein
MPNDNILNQRKVTVEFEGRTITGAYTVWSGMITVSSAMGGRKVTQLGSFWSSPGLDGLAKVMLRELARDGEALQGSCYGDRQWRNPLPMPDPYSRSDWRPNASFSPVLASSHKMVLPSMSTSANAAMVMSPKAVFRSRVTASYQLRDEIIPPKKTAKMSHFIAVPHGDHLGAASRPIKGEPDPVHNPTKPSFYETRFPRIW